MAFCRNCGNEIPEGTKFCPNCGAPAEGNNGENKQAGIKEKEMSSTISSIDKFGKFYGIILLIIAFAGLLSDSAFMAILLSAVVIVGCVFCLYRKYKLKIITILALIIAIIALVLGMDQAKEIKQGEQPIVVNVTEEDNTENIDENVSSVSDEEAIEVEEEEPVIEEKTVAEEEAVIEEETVAEEEAVIEEETVAEETKPVGGVDPDLKAFLDSYEEFVDEYVDFMNKYTKDPGNAISMLSEYNDMLKKYTDFSNKISKYDSDEMTVEDAKYYLEVLSRCNEKLLGLL